MVHSRARSFDAAAAAGAVLKRHRLPPDDVDPQDETPWRAALATLGEIQDDAIESVRRRLGSRRVRWPT